MSSHLSLLLLLGLFVLDVATDIATGVELVLNDHNDYGLYVFGLVLLPVLVAIAAEILRGCVYAGCCGEASTDWIPLIFYHLYTVVMMGGSHFQPRWTPEAHYLRHIQGFFQAGPQLILQSVIVCKGALIHSFRDTLKHMLESGWDWNFFSDKPLGWYWGLIQVFSLLFSFLSLLQTCLHFNEWAKRRHTLHRLLLILPFFAATILFRLAALALLFTFAGRLALLPVLLLLLAQVLTFHSLGLDLLRSLAYGLCSLLAPAGYSRGRDPDGQPLGLSLLPGYVNRFDGTGPGRGDRSPEQVEQLRRRSKDYLAMYVILGGGVLGIALAILFLLVNFTQTFRPLSGWIIFTEAQLNDAVFPTVAAAYLATVLLTAVFTVCIGRCFEEEYIYPV